MMYIVLFIRSVVRLDVINPEATNHGLYELKVRAYLQIMRDLESRDRLNYFLAKQIFYFVSILSLLFPVSDILYNFVSVMKLKFLSLYVLF
jgi:hypothetical protein